MAKEEKIRIRLSFEDAKILRKSQRSDGLQCCWMLLRSDLHTISAFSSSIVSTFRLQKKCPNGLLLSMDDYVLPHSETTSILNDKDIIRIRKKDGKSRVISRDNTHENEDAPFKEKEPKFPCSDLLPINQSDKEHGDCGDKKSAIYQLTASIDLAGPSCRTPSMKRKRQNDSEFNKQTNDQFASCEGYMEKLSAPAEVKKTQSRNARRKKEKRLLQASWRKSKDHSPQPQIPQEAPAREIVEQSTCSEDDIVPVVVKPGHIRFKAQGKSSDAERSTRQLCDYMVMHRKEPETCNKSCEENKNESTSNRQGADTPEGGTKVHHMNFESFLPLTCFPKEGDVVAYKLVELCTGYPEFSDFIVGRVSSFDPESMQAVLDPVSGFPVSMDKIPQTKLSLYKEDGSLEIDFMSLIDVRLVRDYNSDMASANKSMKTCNILRGQSSTCSWNSRRACCPNMKAADLTSNSSAGNNINAPTSKSQPMDNWDSWLPGTPNCGCGVKVANSALENKENQGRDWDEIKSSDRVETVETSEGWPQWKSREYLANTSWSFLLRGPPPRPSKKRRATGVCTWDAPRRNNSCKG